ncbi:unnamed protein product, partial [Linum tenue]
FSPLFRPSVSSSSLWHFTKHFACFNSYSSRKLTWEMDGAQLELERRSNFLNSLIQRKKATDQQDQFDVRVRASDMPIPLQTRAFACARQQLDSMPGNKVDSKRLALALKKEFDAAHGPAWHCIVGTSFGSYVTHAIGGFLYFSIDKIYILLFKTAVEPFDRSE